MGKYERKRRSTGVLRVLLSALTAVISLWIMTQGLRWGLTHVGVPDSGKSTESASLAVMDRYDMYMTNVISNALEGLLDIEKTYWLSDDDMIAPEPDQSKFGKASDSQELAGVLEDAAALLDGQQTLFTTETELFDGSEITYYLDETILCVTWKQVIHNAVYTFSEVKIAHPSQLRRFVADGVYGSDKQYRTTEMAATVNAVTASSGDFYKFRPYGISVYNRQVYRYDSRVDTCFFNDDGEMLFVRAGELSGKEAIDAYVQENNVRFSLAFGPVLVDDSQVVPTGSYPVGEIDNYYPRAAIGYMGPLHYLLVACNQEGPHNNVATIERLAQTLQALGCQKAYTLDGGQTAVIVTNDELINRPSYGYQRTLSDIIYFATAIPDGGQD